MGFEKIDNAELPALYTGYKVEFFPNAIVLVDCDGILLCKCDLTFLGRKEFEVLNNTVKSMIELAFVEMYQEFSANKQFMSQSNGNATGPKF